MNNENQNRREDKELTVAGFWIRLFATVIDNVLVIVLSLPFILYHFGDLGWFFDPSRDYSSFDAWYYIFTAFVVILLWVTWDGKTPGKALCGIHIVKIDNTPIGWKEAILRYIGYIVSVLTLFIGFLMIAARRDKRGLHDLIAKTKVTYIN